MLPCDTQKPGLRHDLKTLALFVGLYCRTHHQESERKKVDLKTHDIADITGKDMYLCHECTQLLTHAFVKRSVCPMNPKPSCKHCPQHCYAPRYRTMIREVMKSSGMRMVLTGRVDYLYHLLF